MNKHFILSFLLLSGAAHLASAQMVQSPVGQVGDGQEGQKFDAYKDAFKAATDSYLEGNKEQSLSLFKQASDLARTSSDKYSALLSEARIYGELGQPDLQMNALEQVARLGDLPLDKQAAVKIYMADAFVQNKQNDKARASLQEVIDNPAFDDAAYGTARMFYLKSYFLFREFDKTLQQVDSVVQDPRISARFKALAMQMAGETYSNETNPKADPKLARQAFLDSLNYFSQAVAAKQARRVEMAPVFTAMLAGFEKHYGREFAQRQAVILFNPFQTEASKLRLAQKNKEALDYYQAIDGISPYLPPLYKLLMREGLGSTLMYSGYFDDGNKVLSEVADTAVPADDEQLNYVVQNARRMLGLSHKFQGEVKGGKEQFDLAREEWNKLLAMPDLQPEVAKRVATNIAELNRLDPQ